MAVSLEKFNCNSLEIKIEFDEKQFQKKDFILDIKPIDETDTFFHYHFGSKSKKVTDFAVLDLILDGETSSLRLHFTKGTDNIEDVREPYLENVAQWLGGFFNTEDLQATLTAFYVYENDFEPLVNLNFPLLVKNDLYNGVNVSGLILDFPDKSDIQTIYLSAMLKEEITAMLYARPKIDLSNFDLYATVKKYSTFTSGFFEKKVKKNAKASQRK